MVNLIVVGVEVAEGLIALLGSGGPIIVTYDKEQPSP